MSLIESGFGPTGLSLTSPSGSKISYALRARRITSDSVDASSFPLSPRSLIRDSLAFYISHCSLRSNVSRRNQLNATCPTNRNGDILLSICFLHEQYAHHLPCNESAQ